MTTYILAGGADRKSPAYGKKLATEIRKKNNGQMHVLSCFFAEPREVWESKFAQRQKWFCEIFGTETTLELAFPDTFREQVKRADIVYIHGGEDSLLGLYLNQYDDIQEMFAGKIVVGSSAGADWLSAHFWTCDWRKAMSGSAIVPLNIMVHYDSEYGKDDPRGAINWPKVEEEFRAGLGKDAQITRLPEGEFVVYES